MIRKPVLFILLSIIALVCFVGLNPQNAFTQTAWKGLQTLSQPDGQLFKALQWGDDSSNGWETALGYDPVRTEPGVTFSSLIKKQFDLPSVFSKNLSCPFRPFGTM